MRRLAGLLLTFAFTLVGGPSLRPILSAPAEAPDLTGTWKLTIVAFGNDEFVIVDLKPADGKLAGTVTNSQALLGPLKTAEGTVKGSEITLRFPGGRGEPLAFHGVVDQDGKGRGNIRFSGRNYPGELVRTEEKAVAKLQPSTLSQKLATAQARDNAKEKVAKIQELIQESPGHPKNAACYTALLGVAEAAGLGPEEVRALVEKWTGEARPYGSEWTAEVQSRALKALQGKKMYAPLATEMALAADKALPADAELEVRGNIVTLLARSARLAGKDTIAAEAESRARVIDDKLDAEYHEKVPPFKPEPFAGRAGGKGTRTVVMEIFTGAECPPCVAADVAFDALLSSYKPTEVIGLQHHLHIPGPDPLTNTDTVARQTYYGNEVRGTPSTFFNGKAASGGGGGMDRAEVKHKDYRTIIDPALEGEKLADIKLTATRAGDEVKIDARATATAGHAAGEAKPRLRLVLIEQSVRYPGSNKLRFHHNVVRSFPGGVEGKALEGGEGSVAATVDLSELRKSQEAYLEQYPASPRGRAFPNPLPPIDLDDLAVVALVQDDADHSIWHAVQVPVTKLNP
jgi:hypothetical protein